MNAIADFDIHTQYANIDKSTDSVLASLTCCYKSDSLPTDIGCMVNSTTHRTPTELLYSIYELVKTNIRTKTNFPSFGINADFNISDNSYLLKAKFIPTCPYTVVEVDTWSGEENITTVCNNIQTFFESLINNHVLTPDTALASKSTNKNDAITAALLELRSCINNCVNQEYLITVNCPRALMKPFILLRELDLLIDFLADVCRYSINVVFIQNDVTIKINGNITKPSLSPCGYDPTGYKILIILQQAIETSAIKNELIKSANVQMYSVVSNTVKYNLSQLVRFSSLPNSSQKMLVDDSAETDGKFEFSTKIEKTEIFDKDKIKEKCREVAQLEVGKIASRSNVLKAIYEIFYYWLNNSNVVNIDVNVCHSNCHNNSVRIRKIKNVRHGGTMFIEGDITGGVNL